MKIKNKLILVLTIAVICVFSISSYVCATDEENTVNENITTENANLTENNSQNENTQNEDTIQGENTQNENIDQTENIQNENTQKSEEENKQENEKVNENEKNSENNKSEQENKAENKNEQEKQNKEENVQEDKKEIIKSKNITFNYAHTGKMKSNQYIRKKANIKSKKVIYVKRAKKVTILGEKSNFYKVEYKKGKKKYKGYVKKKFVTLNTNFSISEGNTKTLQPILTPKNSTDKIKYKSSDKSIATVDSYGKITAHKKRRS